ncbi:MAG: UvrD-helicase domain-containing protein [Bacteroidales bacterium]|nr:UvrD-helicase domain-containing protein [Bacteroidales bacterium]
MVSDLLTQLNDSQREAVVHTEGPVMIIAGAGSGKTRALTYRIAYMLEKGVDPFSVLALTFTNKAAKEMKSRIMELVGSDKGRNVWMGTFHSIFARMLRVEGHLLGYPQNFTIYDSDDSKRLIKSITNELSLDTKVYSPSYVLHRISGAKSNLFSAQDYCNNTDITNADFSAGKPMIGEIFKMYNTRLKRADAMDFDDLLFNTNVLLRDFPEVLYKYQHKFKYVLVDEYQDTNYAQYLIIKRIAALNENICVVGDDAQSIYSFRGANIQNILNFKIDYPDNQLFRLEQNYRSTKTIVNAANGVIAQNKDQIKKTVWTDKENGELITLLRASSDNEEGTLVANSIFGFKMSKQLPNNSFAILYRTNAQSRSIEEALRRQGIPYKIFGGLSFYSRKEVKDLLGYFRLVINHNDEEALLRIINYPARGIGKTTIERLQVIANEQNRSIWELIEHPLELQQEFNKGVIIKLDDFVTKIKSFSVQMKTKTAFDLARHITTSVAIVADLKEDDSPEGVQRIENIESLLNAIQEYSEKEPVIDEETGEAIKENTLQGFMQDVALLTDADNDKEENADRVVLMTIHAAKGLEFPYVYIVGVEENLFPSIQSLGTRAELEEERRLFYVAITRAELKLTISYAESRFRWGTPTLCEPSRFIEEIDAAFIEQPRKKISFQANKPYSIPQTPKLAKNLKKLEIEPMSLSEPFESSESDKLEVGMTVLHQKFGQGRITDIEGAGANKKATVAFAAVGNKQLILKFAKLRIINEN